MAVPTGDASETVKLGAGTTSALSVDFNFLDPDDLVITPIVDEVESETPLVRGVDYTVGGGMGGTGFVTPLAAIPVGTSWRIRRETPIGQPNSFPSGNYSADQHELTHDRAALILQELKRDVLRAFLSPRGTAGLTVLATQEGDLLQRVGNSIAGLPVSVIEGFATRAELAYSLLIAHLGLQEFSSFDAGIAGTSVGERFFIFERGQIKYYENQVTATAELPLFINGVEQPKIETIAYGALTRNQFAAGYDVDGLAIVQGDPNGHWFVDQGRIYPSADGDAADLNAGPYILIFENDDQLTINIEADTMDVRDQSEWDHYSAQGQADPANILGKTIALRNGSSILNLGITGAGPLIQNDIYDSGPGTTPFTVKGRTGDVGSFIDYCLVDNFGVWRGVRGVKFEHLRVNPAAETKCSILSQAANNSRDVSIDDCWISGLPADPNGDYSDGTSYPNFGVSLISTGGKTGPQGNVSVTNCLIEWGGVLVSCAVEGAANEFLFEGNECRYFYGDAVQAVNSANEQAAHFICRNNFIHSCVGRADDTANSHADSIRVQGSTTSVGDMQVTIEDNVIMPGDARGDAQGIFLDDMKSGGVDSGNFFVALIRRNWVQVKETGHGISGGQMKNTTYSNNTAIGCNDPALNDTPVFISMGVGTQVTDGGGNATNDNICETILGSIGTYSGNVLLGLNGSTQPYASTFVGPDAGEPWQQTGTADEAKAVFTRLSGTAGAP